MENSGIRDLRTDEDISWWVQHFLEKEQQIVDSSQRGDAPLREPQGATSAQSNRQVAPHGDVGGRSTVTRVYGGDDRDVGGRSSKSSRAYGMLDGLNPGRSHTSRQWAWDDSSGGRESACVYRPSDNTEGRMTDTRQHAVTANGTGSSTINEIQGFSVNAIDRSESKPGHSPAGYESIDICLDQGPISVDIRDENDKCFHNGDFTAMGFCNRLLNIGVAGILGNPDSAMSSLITKVKVQRWDVSSPVGSRSFTLEGKNKGAAEFGDFELTYYSRWYDRDKKPLIGIRVRPENHRSIVLDHIAKVVEDLPERTARIGFTKELMAVVACFEELKRYLKGCPVGCIK